MSLTSSTNTGTPWLLSGQVEEDAPIRDIPISVIPFQIGRGPGVALRIPSPTVSNVHAQFHQHHGHLILRDLKSTNGTYVNGERILTVTVPTSASVGRDSTMAAWPPSSSRLDGG